jgi:hypothetical protein
MHVHFWMLKSLLALYDQRVKEARNGVFYKHSPLFGLMFYTIAQVDRTLVQI